MAATSATTGACGALSALHDGLLQDTACLPPALSAAAAARAAAATSLAAVPLMRRRGPSAGGAAAAAAGPWARDAAPALLGNDLKQTVALISKTRLKLRDVLALQLERGRRLHRLRVEQRDALDPKVWY